MLRLFTKVTFSPQLTVTSALKPSQTTTSTFLNALNKNLNELNRPTIVFDFVNEIEVNISHKELASTAKIIIPRKVTFDGQDIATGTDALFRRGDFVIIECGYYPDLKTVFKGYITGVNLGSPITVECEDEMFQLNKKHILFPLKNNYDYYGKKGKKYKTPKPIPTKIKLKDFIKNEVLKDTKYADTLKCDIDMEIAIKRFDCSAREVLNKLKETFPGFYAYFQDGILNVSFLNDASVTNTEEFIFEETIIDDKNLFYRRQEDIELVCRATSYDVDTGKQIQVTEPEQLDPNSIYAHIDVFTSIKMTEKDLRAFARKNVESRKYEGYRGSFTTFGEPYVRPGDAAKLISLKYPEKNGVYIIDSVTRTFGVNGYRQIIELGVRVVYNDENARYDLFSKIKNLT